jgi:two-component system OmpR family sensor kinase
VSIAGPLRKVLRAAALRTRVLIATCLVVAAALAVMGFASVFLLRANLISRDDTQLRAFAALTAKRHALPLRPVPPRLSRPGDMPLPSAFLLEIVNPNASIKEVVRTGSHGKDQPPAPKLPASDLRATATPFTVQAGSHAWRVLVQALPGHRYGVVALSLDTIVPVVSQLVLIELLAGLIALGLLMATGFWLIRASLAPLGDIEHTAESIAAGDLSQRIPDYRPGTEVGRLAAALNTMLARIEAAYQARAEGELRAQGSEERLRRFVADASHELRTPLTSIRGFADFHAQQGNAADRAETDRLMSRIRQEATRMGDLVDDLLLLAHLDEQRTLDLRPVDLSSLAADAVRDCQILQPDRRLAMRAEPEPVVVIADEARMRQVIGNLLSNALHHTPPGTPVDVSVCSGDGESHLTVADQGPGMSRQQAEHVFERFYRADPARGRASGGSGLGLSIVAALVSAHGGRAEVDTAPGRGCTFHIWLPLAGHEPEDSPVGTSYADTGAHRNTGAAAPKRTKEIA